MSRVHTDTRISDQIRTLFHAGALGSVTDGQLLDHYLSPDGDCSELAFAGLVERHGPMVLGVCRRLISDRHAAEDAFQATFLVLGASQVGEKSRFAGRLAASRRAADRNAAAIESRASEDP